MRLLADGRRDECAVQLAAVGADVCSEMREDIIEIDKMKMASRAALEHYPKEVIENIVKRCIQILAKPRAKEFVPIPVAGWPEWPIWPLKTEAEQRTQSEHHCQAEILSDTVQKEPTKDEIQELSTYLAPPRCAEGSRVYEGGGAGTETCLWPADQPQLASARRVDETEVKRCGGEPPLIATNMRGQAPPGLDTPTKTSNYGAIARKSAVATVSNRFQ